MNIGEKKTIIYTNEEPPKNYIWIKDNSTAYEFDGIKWVESPIIKDLISNNIKKSGLSLVKLEDAKFVKNDTYKASKGKAYRKIVVAVPEIN